MDLRAKHPAIEVGVDTLDGWRRHISGRNASVLAFFGFLSIFPLMLAATTILGLVLQNNDDLQKRIINGALADIPVIGQQLQNDPASLNGSVWVLIAGLVAALWSATKAFVALQGALDDVWEVSVDHRDAMPKQRGKALLGLALIGGAQIAGLAMTTIVNAGRPAARRTPRRLRRLGGDQRRRRRRDVPLPHRRTSRPGPTCGPGSIAAGIAATLIQNFGTMIVVRISKNASDTYGQFAVVLGLVTWLSLLAIATIMSAELNACTRAPSRGFAFSRAAPRRVSGGSGQARSTR